MKAHGNNFARLDISSFHTQLQDRLAELRELARKNTVNAPALRKELADKKQEAWNLTDFIVANGRQSSPTIQARLATAEARIKETGADANILGGRAEGRPSQQARRR